MSAIKHRVQMDFSENAKARLDSLKDRTDATSYTEVMRNALRVYEALIAEVEAGKTFMTRDANGQIAIYRMFLR